MINELNPVVNESTFEGQVDRTRLISLVETSSNVVERNIYTREIPDPMEERLRALDNANYYYNNISVQRFDPDNRVTVDDILKVADQYLEWLRLDRNDD